jgi:site-specific recombinase XerD
MKLTGHKAEAVYRRYAIVAESDLREGGAKLAAALGTAAAAVSLSDNSGDNSVTAEQGCSINACRLCRARHKRHTYASQLLAEGAPITYVAAQLGHARPTTTLAHYAHWIPRGDKGWVDRLAARRLEAADEVGTKRGRRPRVFQKCLI